MRTLALLSAVLLLAACGSEGEAPPPLTARDFALVKVSGDGQSEMVKLGDPGPSLSLSSFARLAEAPEPDMFPEALVVKVVPRGGPTFFRGGSLMPTSPSFAEAPGWLPTVTWRVLEEGCGEPFTAAELPAGDSTVATFWFKGTRAGTCHMRAQTVERDSAGNLTPVVQQEFTATQLPGPPVYVAVDHDLAASMFVTEGGAVNIAPLIGNGKDVHGNVIPRDSLLTEIAWAFYGGEAPDPTAPEATGTLVNVPADWCDLPRMAGSPGDDCYVGVMIWAQGIYAGGVHFQFAD